MSETSPPIIFAPRRRLALRARMQALQARPDAPRYLMADMVEDVIERMGFLRVTPARALVVGEIFVRLDDFSVEALVGKLAEAGSDLGRLLINSTVGIFGLFDVASELGLERHEEDFGQTLAVWGAGDGGYLYWPLVGPKTVRDTFGLVGDIYTDPTWGTINKSVATRNSMVGLRFVETRASLLPTDKVVEEAALEKYAYVRDAYLQRRRSLIFDGRPPREDDDY